MKVENKAFFGIAVFGDIRNPFRNPKAYTRKKRLSQIYIQFAYVFSNMEI